MNTWRRRIRGAIGIGLTWAAAWFGAGMLVLLVVGVGAADVPFPLFFGLLGFLAGATFSMFLGILARRRRFDQLSFAGITAWGAVGGVVLAGILVLTAGPVEFLVVAPVFAVAGAISAAGTLALARRAEKQGLLDPKGEAAEPALKRDGGRQVRGPG